jgi:tetratricopeptide (TPR) repeat protein
MNGISNASSNALVRMLGIAALIAAAGCELASQGLNVDGVRQFQQGNYQAAAQRFNSAIANDPVSAEGYYNLAATLHRTGTLFGREEDLKQAENLYNQCLEWDADHVDCYRGLAVLLTETGRTDAAFRLLEGWHKRSPHSPEPKVELARLLEETGSDAAAKSQLIEALALDPHNSRALTALARIRDREGDFVQALSDYQRSLAINRMQPEVKTRVATLSAALGGAATSAVVPDDQTRFVRQPSATARY